MEQQSPSSDHEQGQQPGSGPDHPSATAGGVPQAATPGTARSEKGDALSAQYDFDAAFVAYTESYRGTRAPDNLGLVPASVDTDVLMKSARAVQMAENWRAQAGTWEMLGDTLGRRIDERAEDDLGCSEGSVADPYTVRDGRELFRQFHVISDKEWAALDECPQDCASRCGDRRRQASAYEWAAETAQANARHPEAARLFRRAGWAWEKALHYAAGPAQSGAAHTERKSETSRNSDEARASRQALVRAAFCYAQAAANATRTSRSPTRQMITSIPWCPACQHDKTSERNCRHPASTRAGTSEEDLPATDISRIRRVWDCVADHEVPSGARGARRGWRLAPDEQLTEFREGLRQLSMIQGLLAGQGARREARQVYRQRQRMAMDRYKSVSRLPYLRKALGHLISGNGSSLPRFLTFLAVVYLLVLPLAWLVMWSVVGVPKQPDVDYGWLPVEAVIFSLSSMVTLSNGHFAPGGWATNLAQSLQAVSSYFALGYSLYVAQRSYTV